MNVVLIISLLMMAKAFSFQNVHNLVCVNTIINNLFIFGIPT